MNPATFMTVFEIVGGIAQRIAEAIDRNDDKELKRLAEIWDEPIKSRLTMMALEAKARRSVNANSGGE